eukprot:TRINITY_DN2161_c0_g1_i1.p1 TRINITY_DN2161_c0_g1~~TRINITY_DN2161_c0_g1_i1.p1  ORF type:complete len:795 (+),score=56.06 TRINITY_DN2161_c0_g1_i1:91-2385(+)
MKKEQKPPSKKSVAPTEPKERGMQHRKREYRRDEYAKVDEDPLMKTADLQPRLINIDQFVESRAFELKHFLKILRAKGAPGGKLPFQSLPRHMRRRAMSHNYYRIPLRLRYADTVERIKEKAGDAVGRSRCRKHLRKSRVLLSEYKRRARTTKWLETHIWHAKRFHMTDLWGYKIANHCNDKSERAAYRFAAHDCCIIDKSYFHWIWLKGESKEHLAGLLQKHSYKPVAEMSGKKAFNTLWTDAEGKILAPVVILFNPSSMGTECLVCVHPAGVNDFTTSIQNSSIKYVPLNPSTLCTFQMYGKKAMQAAANVLLPLAVPRQPILNLVESIEDPSILPNNAVIGLKIRKPKSKFRMNERILRKEQNIEELKGADQYVYHKRDCNYSMNSAAPAFLETLLNWDAKFAECGLWDYEYLKKLVIEQPENMKITNRTRFYHKKKKPDLHKLLEKFKLMKVKPSATLAPIKEIEEEKVLSKSELQTVKETTEIEDKKDNNTMWVWIIIESSTTQKHFGSGLKIIFPAGIGLQLWRRLIYAGAKAVGLREQTSILHEKGLFVYPNDFPLTAPYDQMKRAEGVELAIEHYRKPPSKRVNYQKVGFCYPFISLWNDLVPTTEDIAKLRIAPFINREVGTPALYPVHIAMAKRYVPKERATICVCLTKVFCNCIHKIQLILCRIKRELKKSRCMMIRQQISKILIRNQRRSLGKQVLNCMIKKGRQSKQQNHRRGHKDVKTQKEFCIQKKIRTRRALRQKRSLLWKLKRKIRY